MDPSGGSTAGGTRLTGKRARAYEFMDQPDGVSDRGATTHGQRFATSSVQGDSERKRPKLSTLTTDDVRPGEHVEGRYRRSSTLADLPPEILQHIFTFVHPISLGRLICVNRLFSSLLDPTMALPQASAEAKHMLLRSQDSIWSTSRHTFLHGLPKPMDDMTELGMWRLIRGKRCQYCGKTSRPSDTLATASPWSAGPGSGNVRTIWPFRIRSCGDCLVNWLVKVSALQFVYSDRY